VEELRASQQQLQDAIAQLKTIPTSAKIYNTAQNELSDYQTQLTKIQRRLDKENQAIDSINQAKQQAQDAEEQMGKAQTVSEYEAVKEKWDKALAILNDIPSDVFISVTNLKNSYESKKKEVVAIIEDLNKPTPSPEPTPTSTPTPDPTPTPTPTSERTPSLSDPKWDYSVFNSSSVGDYAVFSYKMIEEPAFNQQNQQVEWIVEFSIPPEAERSPAAREAYLRLELWQDGFRAKFIDSSGAFLGAKNLDKEGQAGYRRRYTLRVPNSIWEKWSEVSQVIIEKQ
jgi:hypothetical protein